MEMYGWDRYSHEGLRELEKIKSSRTLATKTELPYYIDKFIELYRLGRIDQIKGAAFFPALKKITSKEKSSAASKLVSKNMANLRMAFTEYYENEGKEAEFEVYFVAPQGNYLLGVKHREIKEVEKIKPSDTAFWDISVKEINKSVIDFFKIYWEGWVNPGALVARSVRSGNFNWDTIFFHLVSLILIISLFAVYVDKLMLSDFYREANLLKDGVVLIT